MDPGFRQAFAGMTMCDGQGTAPGYFATEMNEAIPRARAAARLLDPPLPDASMPRQQNRERWGLIMAVMSEFGFQQFSIYEMFGPVPAPAFEAREELESGWGRNWGCDNDIGRLRAVLMHRPGPELNVVDTAKPLGFVEGYGDKQAGWYYNSNVPPNLPAIQAQHDALTKLLRDEGVDVILTDKAAPNRSKSVFTRDSAIGVKGGAIVTRLARRVRRGEERPVTQALAAAGCPILHTIHGEGIFEGGGFAMINSKTAVCSVSVACNEEGVAQIESVLRTLGIELIKVYLSG